MRAFQPKPPLIPFTCLSASLGKGNKAPALPGEQGAFTMPQSLEEVVKTISTHIKPIAPAIDKAKAIYDWILENIEYDNERMAAIDNCIENGIPYSPEITLKRRKGICSDLSVLYVAIAREMGLNAHFLDVTVDCNGTEVCHACAMVDVKTRNIQVDISYKLFDARHKTFEIENPPIKGEYGIINGLEDTIKILPKRKLIKIIFAAGALISGIMSYFTGFSSSSPKNEKITMLESTSSANFVSNSGVLKFSYDKAAESALKEYVFFIEAKEGRLSDGKIFEKYLAVDTNKDGAISFEEAAEAKKSARDKYFEKKSH
jgi:hypothetical protein